MALGKNQKRKNKKYLEMALTFIVISLAFFATLFGSLTAGKYNGAVLACESVNLVAVIDFNDGKKIKCVLPEFEDERQETDLDWWINFNKNESNS